MSELFFALKMAAITFVLVLAMQVRVNETTIEEHAHLWIQTAAPVLFLREVAEGGLAAIHDGWAKATSGIKTKYWNKYDSSKMPGSRHLDIFSSRSDSYLEEQKLKSEEIAKQQELKKKKVDAELASRAQRVREVIGLGDNEPEESDSE